MLVAGAQPKKWEREGFRSQWTTTSGEAITFDVLVDFLSMFITKIISIVRLSASCLIEATDLKIADTCIRLVSSTIIKSSKGIQSFCTGYLERMIKQLWIIIIVVVVVVVGREWTGNKDVHGLLKASLARFPIKFIIRRLARCRPLKVFLIIFLKTLESIHLRHGGLAQAKD